MKTKKKVLVMCLADPSANPRPRRVISTCKEMRLSVDVACLPVKTPLDFDHHYLIDLAPKKFIKRIIRFFFKCVIWLVPSADIKNFANNYYFGVIKLVKQIARHSYDVIIVENLQLLPLAFKVKSDAKLIFDAREYYPRQNEESIIFRFFEKPERIRLCNSYLPFCDTVLTVSPGLAREYKREFDITAELIRSVPMYSNCQAIKVQTEKIRMVHHGVAIRNRQLEKMIDIFSQLDNRFTLDFYLLGNDQYINELKKLADPYKNLKFKVPMLFEEIVSTLNSYDVGFFYVEPTTFNLQHCLPNKLFEFIQARLMVAVGPSPDMAALVKEYQCGVVADSFDPVEMAKVLNSLTAGKIMEYKNNSDIAAKTLCFEQEGKKLQNIISHFC